MPHSFGARRTARFSRHDYLVALGAKPRRQPLDLRRFTSAFAAFESDEESACHIRSNCGHRKTAPPAS
jgi:hypothetical protein